MTEPAVFEDLVTGGGWYFLDETGDRLGPYPTSAAAAIAFQRYGWELSYGEVPYALKEKPPRSYKPFDHWVAPWPLSKFLQNVWFTVDTKIEFKLGRKKQVSIPISISPPFIWWGLLNSPGERMGIFRKHIKSNNSYRPNRWGFWFLGFEVGRRG